MEQSPLSQLARPEKLQPKVVELYRALFDEELHLDYSEGFWRELFLLKPEREGLEDLLEGLSADALLHFQTSTQQLFARAIHCIQSAAGPADENALDTLIVFLDKVLNKRWNSPSSDIISVIGGLDSIDTIFAEFVAVLDGTINHGRNLELRRKATQVSIVTVAGAYQTGLVSYFVNRDFFPALMKLVQDADTRLGFVDPFAFLGLLANYNKFEFQNPYGIRLEDYVIDDAILKMTSMTSDVLEAARDEYLAVQEDATETWSILNPLSYIGLAPRSPRLAVAASDEDALKAAFAVLPTTEASVLLPMYDFVHANKLFAVELVTVHEDTKNSGLAKLLSFASYLFQNAHRSVRASQYACLTLLILRILIEDVKVAQSIIMTENAIVVRLCRQRPPTMPLINDARRPIAVLLDVIIDGINHNLRRRLDVELYSLFLDIVLRSLSFLSHTRFRLEYHWAELWRCLLSFVRFLNTYAPSLQSILGIEELVNSVCNILAFALSTGEAFLPDAKSYDDLFYKVFESGEQLSKFRDTFELAKSPKASAAITILANVANHFNALLEEQKGKGNKNMSPREVTKLIKQGYDSLSIDSKDVYDRWLIYREVDYRNLLKRVTRVAVQDVRTLGLRS